MTSGWPGGFGDIQVIASAEGFGPAWTGLAEIKGEIELRLVPDDIPIEGRLLTLEGRPIAGITVRTLTVEDPATSQTVFGIPSGFFQSATYRRRRSVPAWRESAADAGRCWASPAQESHATQFKW